MVAGSDRRRGGIDAVQQEIDDDAGDRDIQPDGESPAGDAPMTIEFLSQSTREGNHSERQNNYRQHGVSGEQGEVDRANPALPLKMNDSGMQMIDDIGREKGRGAKKREKHKGAVRSDPAAADLDVTRG